MTKVIESDVLSFLPPDSIMTILTLDKEPPLRGWRRVSIDGTEFEPIFASGMSSDRICIKGAHNFDGEQVDFI